MVKKPSSHLIPVERIERAILILRGEKVVLDRDLADLYGVKAIALRQQVSRNEARFPADFMFRLSQEEADALVSQNVIPSKRSLGGSLPYAFTQEGVAMLSSVLRSERAVLVNIEIMRTFVRLRAMLASNAELTRRLDELEGKYDVQFRMVFDAIRELMATPSSPPRRRIGFHVSDARKGGVVHCYTREYQNETTWLGGRRPVVGLSVKFVGGVSWGVGSKKTPSMLVR